MPVQFLTHTGPDYLLVTPFKAANCDSVNKNFLLFSLFPQVLKVLKGVPIVMFSLQFKFSCEGKKPEIREGRKGEWISTMYMYQLFLYITFVPVTVHWFHRSLFRSTASPWGFNSLYALWNDTHKTAVQKKPWIYSPCSATAVPQAHHLNPLVTVSSSVKRG